MDRRIGAARKIFVEVAAPEQRRGGQLPVLAARAIVAAVALAASRTPAGRSASRWMLAWVWYVWSQLSSTPSAIEIR